MTGELTFISFPRVGNENVQRYQAIQCHTFHEGAPYLCFLNRAQYRPKKYTRVQAKI